MCSKFREGIQKKSINREKEAEKFWEDVKRKREGMKEGIKKYREKFSK